MRQRDSDSTKRFTKTNKNKKITCAPIIIFNIHNVCKRGVSLRVCKRTVSLEVCKRGVSLRVCKRGVSLYYTNMTLFHRRIVRCSAIKTIWVADSEPDSSGPEVRVASGK